MKNNSIFFLQFPPLFYPERLLRVKDINLTARQLDIISCLTGGKTAKETGTFLSISEKTVETHKSHIYKLFGCHYQRELVSFVEESEEYEGIRNHYARLLYKNLIEQELVKISRLKRKNTRPTLEFRLPVQEPPLARFFLHHMEIAGVHVCDNTEKTKNPELNPWVLTIPENVPEHLKERHIILIGETDKLPTAGEISTDSISIDLWNPSIYFSSLLLTLGTIYEQEQLKVIEELIGKEEKYLEDLRHSSSIPEKNIPKENKPPEKKNHTKTAWFLPLCLVLTGIAFSLYSPSLLEEKTEKPASHARQMKTPPIHGDLPLPGDHTLLHRPDLFAELIDKMEGKTGIQEVAITGPGGTGKTTLARRYARSLDSMIIWEMNAETRTNLLRSFEGLADAMARTQEDKGKIKQIKDIKNEKERAEKILDFVKKNLFLNPGWVLIYDNVEDFRSIKTHFPCGPGSWGNGKVIITTRNRNIQNCSRIRNHVFIPELSLSEKTLLFLKVYHGQGIDVKLSRQEQSELENFLQQLPPFPLDVILSARYLKNTKSKYGDYLDALYTNDSRFIRAHEEMLISANNYHKTRYSIIKLSIDKMILKHPDYKELLILITLIDSQSIPRFILDAWKNQSTVDNFLHDLLSYSLITPDPCCDGIQTWSIHRSTQEIIAACLKQKMDLKPGNKHLAALSDFLEKFIYTLRLEENFPKMRILLGHGEALLKQTSFLTKEQRAYIGSELAYYYILLSSHTRALDILDKSYDLLSHNTNPKENSLKPDLKMAYILVQRGIVEKLMGNYAQALEDMEAGLDIYRTKFPSNHVRIRWALEKMGLAHLHMGNYKSAVVLLEESARISQTHLPGDHHRLSASLISLGRAYIEAGDFKKAREVLENAYRILTEKLPRKYYRLISWTLGHLGKVYHAYGEHALASRMLQKGNMMYQKHLSGNDSEIAWFAIHFAGLLTEQGDYHQAEALLKGALEQCKHLPSHHAHVFLARHYLGNLYVANGNHDMAKACLEESLEHCEKNWGPHHPETARVLKSLGKLAIIQRDMEKGYMLLRKSFEIFKKNNHPEVFTVSEILSDLLTETVINKAHPQVPWGYENGIDYLKYAADVAKKAFGENSPHFIRLDSKLESGNKNIPEKMTAEQKGP